MLSKLATGLIAVALLAAPVTGSFAATNPAADVAPAVKAKVVKTKTVKAHRHHRQFRIVQCYMTGKQARQVRPHTGHRFQRVACYLPAKVKIAKVHLRNGARHIATHVIKHVKLVKQAKHIKTAKPAHAG
jgi:hypothetical protein